MDHINELRQAHIEAKLAATEWRAKAERGARLGQPRGESDERAYEAALGRPLTTGGLR